MADEYWATFSIYDHRGSLYRRSLALFDRVVIPVPKKPIGNQTEEELDALKADVDYLVGEDAAVGFDWDSDKFHDWQKSIDREILATVLAKDKLYATRFLLKEKFNDLSQEELPKGVDSVTALPVYGTRARYDTVVKELEHDVAEKLTLEVVMENIPMPGDHVGLPEIIELRKRDDYKESLEALRRWQRDQIPKMLKQGDPKELREAAQDFKRLVTKYEKAMSNAKYDKLTTAVCSVLAVGATLAVGAAPLLVTMSGVAPAVFSFRTLITPCWKQVADKECAPAGVVYALSRL